MRIRSNPTRNIMKNQAQQMQHSKILYSFEDSLKRLSELKIHPELVKVAAAQGLLKFSHATSTDSTQQHHLSQNLVLSGVGIPSSSNKSTLLADGREGEISSERAGATADSPLVTTDRKSQQRSLLSDALKTASPGMFLSRFPISLFPSSDLFHILLFLFP